MKTVMHGIIYTTMAGMFFFLTGCKSTDIGLDNNALKPCPNSPNCVSSMAEHPSHYIQPFHYEGSEEDAKKRLISIIESTKRAQVITFKGKYIHAEFTSMIFRFVDDVEFYFDDEKPIVHVRSASRVGYSDLGANRKRVEAIRKQFNQ